MKSSNFTEKNHDPALDLGRLLAIVAVIFIHIATIYIQFPEGSLTWNWGVFLNGSSRFAVPLFLMISGALLLSYEKTSDIRLFFKKRILRLWMPLVFWSAFYILLSYVLYRRCGNGDIFWHTMLMQLGQGSPFYHLWFIYMLPCAYIFYPMLACSIQYLSKSYVILISNLLWISWLLFLISALVYGTSTAFFPYRAIPCIGFAILGRLIYTCPPVYSRSPWFFGGIYLLTCVANWGIGWWNIPQISDMLLNTVGTPVTVIQTLAIFCMVMSLGQSKSKLLESRAVKLIATYSFGIYFIHPVMILIMQKIPHGKSMYMFPVVFSGVLAGSLLIAVCMAKVKFLKKAVQ